MEDQHQKLRILFSETAGAVLEMTDNDLNIRCFTEKQIECITDIYSSVLGKGGFSIVYKGRLDDGRPVAVKRYIFTTQRKEFTKEVIIQSRFSHRNIVRLLGCCIEADFPMLVTEFVPNGNLSDLLHGKNTHQVPLSLNRRLHIASDVAEALVYMHYSQSHPILHGDIKPENIFLDNSHMPKLSDFGISRLLSVNSDEYTGYVIGSMGYIDPEFCQTGHLTTKSDVYSFGVVLLELITRRKAIDDNKKCLAKTFGSAQKFSKHELFDREIATSENMKFLDDIVNLALKCVKPEQEERPEMRDVSEYLRKLQRTQHQKMIADQRRRFADQRRRLKFSLQRTGFTRFITEKQLIKMTDNFKIISTECFMGKVYTVSSEKIHCVRIKMPFEFNKESQMEFSRQIILQSKLKHQNLAMFVGCCLDHGDAPILVYEFYTVSLHDILFGDSHKNCTIHSRQRLEIAAAIAQGLAYLHSSGIVHGDVRTSNMLVGDIPKEGKLYDIPVKVSGLGASVYFSMGKDAQERFKAEGNNGYTDPKFLESGVLTKEVDVYSLGVILLELFTGEKASNHIRNCRIEELWDVAVCYHLESLRQFTFQCLDTDIQKRPTIQGAIECFRRIVTLLELDRQDALFCNDNCAAMLG